MNESWHTHRNESRITHEHFMSHTSEWVMRHTKEWVMSQGLKVKQPPLNRFLTCHTWKWVMSHIWRGHVTHMNESCHTHTNESCHTHMNESYLTIKMKQPPTTAGCQLDVWLGHVTHMNESCHTHEWVMSHESCRIAVDSFLSNDQEPCVRAPPSKDLYQVLRGGSSYTRFLIREHSK